MLNMMMVSGGSAVGKTALLKAALPGLVNAGVNPCICKIDCLHTDDAARYRALGVPCVVGLSQDVCPDHFLVSNLPELWDWANTLGSQLLLIETAGLCHRCSPATDKSTSICVLECTSSCRAPQQLGPMLTQADAVVLSKIDMVSQAEREIVVHTIRQLNKQARLFMVDGLTGFGIEPVVDYLLSTPAPDSFENDRLRYSMPSGVCSYCVGEQRVGSSYQQGVVGKIDFGEFA